MRKFSHSRHFLSQSSGVLGLMPNPLTRVELPDAPARPAAPPPTAPGVPTTPGASARPPR